MAPRDSSWTHHEVGGGVVESAPPGLLRLTLPAVRSGYADAQIDDYHSLPRERFLWKPPLRLELQACASLPHPSGTLGFGFWNDPFTFSLGQGGAARRFPAGPQALWYFYGSPPNDLAFTPDVPGHGWKASCLVSPRIPSLLLTPLALGAVALAQISFLRRPVMRTALGRVRACERLLEIPLDQWHHYELLWEARQATFRVDGHVVMEAPSPPQGPLGFVAWIDNQYAIASPNGGFRFGVLPTPEPQWLAVSELRLSPL